ncbi:hypothetical protein [Pseudomonas bubulae]|uniref:hypothetical protein n=1 Tax=Pseudomonas bubulae TaxID=2316085 RepID=UPI002B1DBCE5|nr:hypothetical protein [Pseudomonas bubulae]
MSTSKFANYDVVRSRLLMQIGELDRLIDEEQSATTPNVVKIAALENEQDALIDKSDLLSAEDSELTNNIAS